MLAEKAYTAKANHLRRRGITRASRARLTKTRTASLEDCDGAFAQRAYGTTSLVVRDRPRQYC